jgi:hypothetical protein
MIKHSFDENNHWGKVFLLLLIGRMSFPELLGQFFFSVEEEVALHAGREVLVEVDDNSAQIVGDPRELFARKSGLIQFTF